MSERKLIMVVDDEEVVRDVLCAFFEKKGYETVAVEDGHNAVSYAEIKKPDIVLLDIKMPFLDGIETCHMLNLILRPSRHTGIIIITGYMSSENIEKAFSSGAVDVIKKPFDLEDINKRINIWFDIRDAFEDEYLRRMAYIEKVHGK